MNPIAILYPGELGAALGRAIVQAEGTAITCLCGRSDVTRARAAGAGFVVVPSLEEVLRQSELVISLVPPSGAIETARSFAACVELARRGNGAVARPTFLDCNSVSPQTKRRISGILSHAGIRCVDGAFFGPANRVGRDNLLALSGPGADQIAPVLQQIVEVRLMGDGVGQASALKMALAIMTKVLCAVFLEVACASASCGQLDLTLDLMRRLHPGIMGFLERSLPTYPGAVQRRVHELKEVTNWLHDLGQSGIMTRGAVTVLERLRLAGLDSRVDWTFEDLLYRIAEADLLRAT